MLVELLNTESMNFLESLGIKISGKKLERLALIDDIKNNPILINDYAQKLHDSFGIKYEDICTYIRKELVEHGLPQHALDVLDAKFKNSKKRKNRLGKLIKTDIEDTNFVGSAMSVLRQ